MRKILSITFALLASVLTWAQPAAPNGVPEYYSDLDVICSSTGADTNFSDKLCSSYTYPDTDVSLEHMHIEMDKGQYVKETAIKMDYSDTKDIEYVHMEIWSVTTTTINLKLSAGGTQEVNKELTAGQWNIFDIKLTDFYKSSEIVDANKWTSVGTVRFKTPNDAAEKADIYVDNYYFHHYSYYEYPQTASGPRQYESDKDILCSFTGTTNWHSNSEGYTYPTSGVTLGYMHFKLDKGKDSSRGGSTSENNFSANETEYVHVEIYPQTNLQLTIELRTGGSKSQTVSLTAHEWNCFDFDVVEDFGATLSAFRDLKFASSKTNADFYVDNYYYHHGVSAPRLTVGEKDANGMVAVTGDVTVEKLLLMMDQIQDNAYKDVVLYDLTGAEFSTFAKNIAARWTASNPNALFCVTSSDYRLAFIQDKTNVGTISSNKFYPKGNIEFVDGYDILYPTYNIGTLPSGSTISYTRESISGVATTILPFDADVPDGVTAYEFSSLDGDVLKFTEVTEMEAFKPYIIEGSSLEVSSTETKNNIVLRPAEVDVTTGVKFTGTFQAISPTVEEDNMYVLTAGGSNAIFKHSVGGKIGAFRAYMQYTEASARTFSVVFDDITTGLRHATPKEIETLFNVYSIDGCVVKSKTETLMDLPAGVYVINGKKVVIK